MPTVIDSLIITLGLDPSNFTSGQKQVAASLAKTSDAADTSAKRIESSGKRAANYMASLKNEVVGLFLAFAGAKGLTDFASGIIQNDAAVGRLSKNIGVSTERIGAWQAAVKEMGGSGGDATSALSIMAKAISDAKMGLRPDNAGVLNALGINQDSMKDPSQMLLRIAEASQRMDPMVFNNLASRLGFTPSMIALLERGSNDLDRNMPRWQKLAALTQADADAAEHLQSQLADLSTLIQGKAQPLVGGLAEAFAKLLSTSDGGTIAVAGLTGVIGAAAAGAAVAYAPFVALATAIGGVVIAYNELSTAKGRSRVARNLTEDKNLISDLWGALHGDPAGMGDRIRSVLAKDPISYGDPTTPDGRPLLAAPTGAAAGKVAIIRDKSSSSSRHTDSTTPKHRGFGPEYGRKAGATPMPSDR